MADEFVRDPAIEAVIDTTATHGWKVIEATIQRMAVENLDNLSALKRPEGISDDFLRGRVDMAKLILKNVRDAINTYQTQRLLASQPKDEEKPVGSPYAEEPANPAP